MTIIGKILLAGIAFCVLASSVAAQNAKTMREQLIGSWDMVSAVVTVDGTQGEVFGPHPQGMLIFERNGRFVQIEITPGLAKGPLIPASVSKFFLKLFRRKDAPAAH